MTSRSRRGKRGKPLNGAPRHSEERDEVGDQGELILSIPTAGELRRDDARGGEHGSATVVQLDLPPEVVVAANRHEAQRVAEVARLLVVLLLPDEDFKRACEEEDGDCAVEARPSDSR